MSSAAYFVLLFMLMSGVNTATSQYAAPSWIADAVFYQIFPERFANGDTSNDPSGILPWGAAPTSHSYSGGDLQGIIDHLDYIASLGVNAIYLNPIFTANSNHKYNTADYLSIDPHFGTESTFVRLVDSCHARGIRVVLDGVFNHTGVDFFAFADLKKNGKKSKYTSWYNVQSYPVGPPNKPNYECWWGFGSLPKLMTGDPEVRKFLFGVTRHWMKLGIDGWRLDVPNEIPHEFWIEWRKLVKSLNPDAYITGEIWENAAPWLRGNQFDGVMNYRFQKACVGFFAHDSLSPSAFDTLLAHQRADYPPEANYALQNLLGSHDVERFLTMCHGIKKRWMLAVLFQMTYPGAPMIYYGDEVGMKGGKDPACRGTMIWDESERGRDMLAWTRSLVALRNQHEVLRRGSFERIIADDSSYVYGFTRTGKDGRACVILNRSSEDHTVAMPPPTAGKIWRAVFPASQESRESGEGRRLVTIPALSGRVFFEERGS